MEELVDEMQMEALRNFVLGSQIVPAVAAKAGLRRVSNELFATTTG